MRYSVVVAFIVALLFASPAFSGYVYTDLCWSTGESDNPSLAVSPDYGLLVAWEELGAGIWTQFMGAVPPEEGTLNPPQFLGPGHEPRAAWTWQGFLLAWIDDMKICYVIADGYFPPEEIQVVDTGTPLVDFELDVHGLTYPGGDAAWITFTMPELHDHTAWFLRVRQDGWDEPELLANNLQMPFAPQLTELPMDGPARPRVYCFQDMDLLVYMDEDPVDGWTPAVTIPGSYSVEMAAAGHPSGMQAVLSLGLQPACPCNDIQFLAADDGGTWPLPVSLLASHESYDWPMSPCLQFDPEGRAHAFWYQLGSANDLTPHRGYLEYRVRASDGTWSDEGGFLDAQQTLGLGERVALAVTSHSQPIFAWSRKDTIMGEPQPRCIVVARPDYVAPTPEILSTHRPLQLDAHPNPFNPRLILEGKVTGNKQATLAVFDLAGRRMAALPVHPDAEGRFTVSWNGTGTDGQPAPSGVYLAKLVCGQNTATRRVVLVR